MLLLNTHYPKWPELQVVAHHKNYKNFITWSPSQTTHFRQKSIIFGPKYELETGIYIGKTTNEKAIIYTQYKSLTFMGENSQKTTLKWFLNSEKNTTHLNLIPLHIPTEII